MNANLQTLTARLPIPALEPAFWDRRYAGEELVWTAEANRFLVQEVAGLVPGKALDLAAGEGRNAVWLAQQGWTVDAVDFSSVGLEKARALARARQVENRLAVTVADLREFTPPPEHYDLVVMVYVQMAFADLGPAIARAARAVAPGGRFVLIAHDASNLAHGFGGPQKAEMLYNAQQVVEALGSELTPEHAGQVWRRVETGSGTRLAIDCLVRAIRR